MMMHVYLPKRYRSPFLHPDLLFRDLDLWIWWLLASAYSSRNLWFWLLEIIDFPYQYAPRVWSRFFEKELWSQLRDLTASRFCILKPQLVDFDRWRWYAPLSLIQILWKGIMELASIAFVDCLSVRSCPTSVLDSKCFQERVGYLQRLCFHVGFLEFQSYSRHKNHFDCPVRSCHTNFLG